MRRKFCLIFVLILPSLFLSAAYCKTNSIASDSTTFDILFVGNSYTYYHSMPQLFKAMAESRFPDRRVKTKFVGHGGASLKQQWEQGRALKQIQTGKWDYVVLQEQSMLGDEVIENGKSFVRNPDLFFEYARKFVNQVQQNGAEAVLYMTWSRKDRPDQQKYLTYAYMSIAKETGSLIAPVGMIWDSLRTHETFDLYEFDGSHPSVYGSYTAALTIYTALFDISPIGVPARLEGQEILKGGELSKKRSLLCDLLETNVEIIQSEVSKLFQQMKASGRYLNVEKAVSDKKPSSLSVFIEFASDLKGQMIMLVVLVGVAIFFKGATILISR